MDGLTAWYAGTLLFSVLLLVVALVFGIGDSELPEAEADLDAHADTGGESGTGAADGPSWLSGKVILGAAAGFGAFGLGAGFLGLTGWATLPVAVLGFFALAVIIRRFVLVPLWRQQSNSLLSRHSYVGCRGRVVLGIRSGETGVVRIVDANGTPVSEPALTDDGSELPAGTEVLVVDVTDLHVVVDPDPLSGKGR